MPEYRVYIIGQDGHFQSCFDLECADDAQACEAGKKFVVGTTLSFGNVTG
jgi:hypothetical protein